MPPGKSRTRNRLKQPTPQNNESDVKSVISNLISEIVETNKDVTDTAQLKRLKKLVKNNDRNVEIVYDCFQDHLKENDSSVRLRCVELCNYMFTRSHVWRVKLTDDFQSFIDLCVGLDQNSKRPGPAAESEKLLTETLKAIREWDGRFGFAYKKLHLGYKFLKDSRKVDFARLELTSDADVRQRNIDRAEEERRAYHRFVAVQAEWLENEAEIMEMLGKIETGLDLLREQQCQAQPSSSSQPRASSSAPATFGGRVTKEPLLNVRETVENTDILDEIRDGYKAMDHKWRRWIDRRIQQLLAPSSLSASDAAIKDRYLQTIIDVKDRVYRAMQELKATGIALEMKEKVLLGGGDGNDVEGVDGDDDDEFEEVDMDEEVTADTGAETHSSSGPSRAQPRSTPNTEVLSSYPKKTEAKTANRQAVMEAKLDPSANTRFEALRKALDAEPAPVQAEGEITAPVAKSGGDEQQQNEEYGNDLKASAPVVPFSTDLQNWEQTTLENTVRQTRWYGREDDAEVELSKDAVSDMIHTRRIAYQHPSMTRVIKACRHPIAGGKLCPRRDRIACPFHGPIIPRDEEGNPVDTAGGDSDRSERKKGKGKALTASSSSTDWRTLEADVTEALGDPKKKGKRRIVINADGTGVVEEQGRERAATAEELREERKRRRREAQKRKESAPVAVLKRKLLNPSANKRARLEMQRAERAENASKFDDHWQYRYR
eukprot:Clim_evm53s253 gene=Clim_evmTU53s253